jgi:hypothetical protein
VKDQACINKVVVVLRLWSNNSDFGDDLGAELRFVLQEEVCEYSPVGRAFVCQFCLAPRSLRNVPSSACPSSVLVK